MALQPFLTRKPNPSIAITNAFGSAMSLISGRNLDTIGEPVPKDAEGLSQLFRLSHYVTALMDREDIFRFVPDEQQGICYRGLALFVQIAGDNISVAGAMPVWDAPVAEADTEAIDLIWKAQAFVDVWFDNVPAMPNSSSTVHTQLLHDSKGLTTGAYYSAKAYAQLASGLSDVHGIFPDADDVIQIKEIRRSTDVFAGAAHVLTAPDSKELQRLCNELLADLTGYTFAENVEEGMLVHAMTITVPG